MNIYRFSAGYIGRDGIQPVYVDVQEPPLTIHGLRGGRSYRFDLDHGRQVTRFFRTEWFDGLVIDSVMLRTFKGGILSEKEMRELCIKEEQK